MNSLFIWDDSFLTRIPVVDEQHKKLVELINELGAVVMSKDDINQQIFVSVREGLLNYVNVHFSDEESLMAEAGLDPQHISRHRVEHESLINVALALDGMSCVGTIANTSNLVDYLIRWLAYHILDVDQSMARQLLAVQRGESPAEAFAVESSSVASYKEPLLSAMNSLFCMVSERNRELRDLNHELETRIIQRTLELEQANRQLQLLSTHDDLTGLPNRRFAFMSLNQLWLEKERYGGSLSVLLLDADHFKMVNDGFGHARGDALLCSLGEQLRQSVRGSDIVCRLGGDEFLVICPRSTLEGTTAVARKILDESRPFFTPDGKECWKGGLSIGIAEADGQMSTPGDLIQAADHALYDAKQKGGACLSDSRQQKQ